MDWVILAGSLGREAPWTRGTARPLLPIPGSTLIDSLLARANGCTPGARIVFANGRTELLSGHTAKTPSKRDQVTFLKDFLPLGTAGCLKACEKRLTGSEILVLGASVYLADDPEWMVEQHRLAGNALTVFCTSDADLEGVKTGTFLRPSGVYCCDPSVLEHIRPNGYQDIKEQLIPALKRAGHRVGAIMLRHTTCEVQDWPTYLDVLSRAVSEGRFENRQYKELTPDVWVGTNVQIAAGARIVGPALLGSDVRVEENAVVIGPTMIGDGAFIGNGAWIMRAVVPNGAMIPAGTVVAEQLAACGTQHTTAATNGTATAARTATATNYGHIASESQTGHTSVSAWATSIGIAAAFVWAFWHTISDLFALWQTNADYSAGQLVGPAVLYMIATRRKDLAAITPKLAWSGLALFLVGVGANLTGAYYLFRSLENIGLLIAIHGLVLGLIGATRYARIWYPMAFLALMLPLPTRIHNVVMLRLQEFGAQMSGTVLEIIGIPALRHGNVLEVAGHSVAVAEACSGLRMALAFLLITGVLAYTIERPRWQRIAILFSSIPIAIICNVLRIVSAAYLYSAGYDRLAEGVFHDAAGLMMVPVALLLVYLELRLFANLVLPSDTVATLMDRVDSPAVASENS